MKVLIIYNPYAAHGRAKKLLPQVKAFFEQKNISIDVRLTQYPSHGIEIVQEIDFSLYDGIVAGGGDGTLFEVVNGYFNNPSEKYERLFRLENYLRL